MEEQLSKAETNRSNIWIVVWKAKDSNNFYNQLFVKARISEKKRPRCATPRDLMVARQTTAAALTCCSYTMQGLWLVDNVFIELTCSIFKIRHGVGWGRVGPGH